ncbi:hypothetical protein N657DRAFT_91809 [Parathielavia appendiculata]|uniref:Uncharacterized protein n=1 Tax=Parathielavia appendiculata TaxID=2587402 RepID=A0AAN6UB31_9PEZI|nr:hypothetical protein N657DRAFT_91809 [Parathielavia appendiculata]
MGSHDAKAGGHQAPSSPKIKQEPDAADPRVHLDLPEATRTSQAPSEVNSKSFYGPPKLPFRPPNMEEGEIVEPPAETISWPESSPFPRALHRRDPLADVPSQRSANFEPVSNNRRRGSAMSPPSGRRRRRGIVPMGFDTFSALRPVPQASAKPARPKPNSLPSSGSQRTGTSNALQPAPTQLLSLECQRRRFNPQFVVKEASSNVFTCSVKLRDITIHGDKAHSSSIDAKHAVAAKALPIVRKWPICSSELAQPYRKDHVASTRVKEEHRALTRAAPKLEQDTVMADVPAVHGRDGGATGLPSRGRKLDSVAERAEVLDQMRRMTRGALPEHILDNAESARVFLEGLVAGVRAARLFEPATRARSRSPAAAPRSSASYRERSPPFGPSVGYRDLDAPSTDDPPCQFTDLYPRPRRDPNLPSTDRYRPDMDSYRPDYANGPRYASSGPSEKEWPHDKFRP